MRFEMGLRGIAGAGDLVRGRVLLGEFELTLCTDGTYLLDGGAMFGVVPKPLWQKRMAADEQNRILLGLNTTVVRTGKHTVVIETGIGNKQTEKMREIQEPGAAAGVAGGGWGEGGGGGCGDQQPSALRPLWVEHYAACGWFGDSDVSECAVLCARGRGGAWAAAAGSGQGELSCAEL